MKIKIRQQYDDIYYTRVPLPYWMWHLMKDYAKRHNVLLRDILEEAFTEYFERRGFVLDEDNKKQIFNKYRGNTQ